MMAITVRQPGASLIACGVQPHETRSWRPPDGLLGQRIAIYADEQGVPDVLPVEVVNAVIEMKSPVYADEADTLLDLPLGAVVATAHLDGYLHVHRLGGPRSDDGYRRAHGSFRRWDAESAVEDSVPVHPTGDYSVGRYVWLLSDVEPLAEPIPAPEPQGGLWTWEDHDLRD